MLVWGVIMVRARRTAQCVFTYINFDYARLAMASLQIMEASSVRRRQLLVYFTQFDKFGLSVVRFLLGLSEGGLYAGVIFYMSRYVHSKERNVNVIRLTSTLSNVIVGSNVLRWAPVLQYFSLPRQSPVLSVRKFR